MKKNIFLFAVASCICICASAFDTKKITKPTAVTYRMEQSLANEFKNPAQVEWSEGKGSTVQASLKVEGQQIHAFFGNDGEYICTTKSVTKENLPEKLRLAMDNKLAGISISAIIQTNLENETSYYFQGVDAKGVKIWKGTANGNIEFIQKL